MRVTLVESHFGFDHLSTGRNTNVGAGIFPETPNNIQVEVQVSTGKYLAGIKGDQQG